MSAKARAIALALALPLAAGCAGPARTTAPAWPAAALPQRVELEATPFFPQREYQCGPAALATLLAASGAPVEPDELVAEVYLPGRRGSLQDELVAALRRRERIAFRPAADEAALAREIAAGRPALVLLNLGTRSWPVWHYAVAIGYDATRASWLLRSGLTRREAMGARRFAGAWGRGGRWSLVALRPGETPAGDDPARFVAAVAEFEALGRAPIARVAYEAAARRWPDAALPRFALGNAELAVGEAAAAERSFERVLEIEPAHVPARNNLAELLARRGCLAKARTEIARARAAAANGPYAAAVEVTAAQIDAGAGGTEPAGC